MKTNFIALDPLMYFLFYKNLKNVHCSFSLKKPLRKSDEKRKKTKDLHCEEMKKMKNKSKNRQNMLTPADTTFKNNKKQKLSSML